MSKVKRIDRQIFLAGFSCLFLFCFLCTETGAQTMAAKYYRADKSVTFKWRYGYSEYPFPKESPSAQEDAMRGVFGWYDGTLWSQTYKNWNGQTLHGVQLLFRGGSPYAREVKCTSDIVPYSAAGLPVSFLLPFSYTIGSEESLAFSFRVKGNGEESIVCKLEPKASTVFTAGMFKVNFIALKVGNPSGVKPLVTVSGMMHIRVYPQLVNYGDRTEFIFSSVTHHMDVESSLVLGSVYKDMSKEDPYESAKLTPAKEDSFTMAAQKHAQLLQQWKTSTAAISSSLQQKAKIEVFCNGPAGKRDRGELRVMAYSGNPVKDFQYGTPTHQTQEMAEAVTHALGKKFSLFRYQHHYLPWKLDNPSELDSSQLPYLEKWLRVAGSVADTVILTLQLSPIIKLYKEYTEMGRNALPPQGIPGAEWDKIQQGTWLRCSMQKKYVPHSVSYRCLMSWIILPALRFIPMHTIASINAYTRPLTSLTRPSLPATR